MKKGSKIVTQWLAPLWTLLVAGLLIWKVPKRLKPYGRSAALALAVVAFVPMLPSSHAEHPRKPSTQVVYRFDESRYLELSGYGCEGAINYVDGKRKIRTTFIEQYGRVFLPRFIHADNDGDFIFFPLDDVSAFKVSRDGGKTFETGRWVGRREFGVEEIAAITVVNRQAFILTKDGRLFMTSKPFGEGWGLGVIDPVNHLPNTIFRDHLNFQGLPKSIPPVKNYQGWTEMHCDPDLEGEPIETLGTRWNAFQNTVLVALAHSIAWPVAAVFGMPGHS